MSEDSASLARSRSIEDRVRAAGDQNTPEELLVLLSEDFEWEVRAAVAWNKKFMQSHKTIAGRLLKDESKIVKAYATKSLGRDDLMGDILDEYQNFIE